MTKMKEGLFRCTPCITSVFLVLRVHFKCSGAPLLGTYLDMHRCMQPWTAGSALITEGTPLQCLLVWRSRNMVLHSNPHLHSLSVRLTGVFTDPTQPPSEAALSHIHCYTLIREHLGADKGSD